jgi:ribose 5-phosphate isomerase A
MAIACAELSVPTTSLLQVRPDWSFDGADEVDSDLNMIKGRGGAMLREKLLLASSPERYILIDESKKVAKLGERAPVPVEVIPEALQLVQSHLLEEFDVREVEVRMAVAKDGPTLIGA